MFLLEINIYVWKNFTTSTFSGEFFKLFLLYCNIVDLMAKWKYLWMINFSISLLFPEILAFIPLSSLTYGVIMIFFFKDCSSNFSGKILVKEAFSEKRYQKGIQSSACQTSMTDVSLKWLTCIACKLLTQKAPPQMLNRSSTPLWVWKVTQEVEKKLFFMM